MNVLFVTTEPPWPPLGGASLRTYNFIRYLGPRHRLHLVCYATARQEVALREAMGPWCQSIHGVPPPDPRGPAQRILGTMSQRLPEVVQRFVSPAMTETVARLLSAEDGFDLIHVVGLEAASAVFPGDPRRGPAAGPRLLLDALNVEYLVQRQAFQVAGRSPSEWPRALYSWIQSEKLLRYEKQLCAQATGVVAVSQDDKAALEHLAPGLRTALVPNGVDAGRYRPPASSAAVTVCLPDLPEGRSVLLFTGTMDYRPNVDAVLWFAEEVFPLVLQAFPNAHFAVVGRNPAASVRKLSGPHVTVTGAVPDDLPFFHRASVFVLPMRFGGGSRLKLLQAMACGLPVVTTAAGAGGVDVCPLEHAVVTDTVANFAESVVQLLRDKDAARRLGQQGRKLALKYDWEDSARRLENFYQSLLAVPSGD